MAAPLTPFELLAAFKAEGLPVREHAGWRTHSRDAATGRPFGPVYGVLIHHTAGHGDRELCFNGRSDLPGPLCHAWLGKTDGLWLLSAGRANHAGGVDGDVISALRAEAARLPVDDETDVDGNDLLYGLEMENLGNGRDPYPAVQYERAVLWAAALCRAHGWSERSVAGHKEVQPGKVDPSFDMDGFRAAVAVRLAHAPGWNPNDPVEDDVPLTDDEITKIAVRVLTLDGVIDNPNPDSAPTNPYISLETAVRNVETVTRRTEKVLAARPPVELTDVQVAALAASVAASPSLAEQIAEKVAVKLAARLAQ
ncbi:N-acetylmuramoyl-L-alanine amidase [Streptomyces sp. NPDC127072]|uniref:N-acetylmuramoyl-L-alanine amidase n=1 Tax=Streptomyces sp. NPDC127072 TaxID=3347129 RepID=UPI0036697F39